MHTLLFLIYNIIVIPLLYTALMIAGIFNNKISRGIRGRRNWAKKLKSQLDNIPGYYQKCWLHVSSLGEFEQAKPVIELSKKTFPNLTIIVSFFSPSGIDNAKLYTNADILCYIPFDSFFTSRKFLRLVSPDLIIIVRHDIWPNFVLQGRRLGIPQLLIDASLSPNTIRMRFGIRYFNKDLFNRFDKIIAISAENKKRFKEICAKDEHISVAGDTRYDQVYKRTLETGKIDDLINSGFFKNKKIFIAGSTWPSDEVHIIPVVDFLLSQFKEFIFVIVPHEPTPIHVEAVISHFNKKGIIVSRYTELRNQKNWKFRVLVIDYMGLLANVYTLADVAYIGGSFGPGVHNVLEAMAYGCPIIVGPRHLNSYEARVAIQTGGGYTVRNQTELQKILLTLFTEPQIAQKARNTAKSLVMKNVGASEHIVEIMKDFLNKTMVEIQ